MSSNSHIALPRDFEKLQGASNFDFWEFNVKNIAKADNQWRIIIGEETRPEETDDNTEDVEDWVERDEAALIRISLSVEKQCVPHVRNATSASEAYSALSLAYKQSGALVAFNLRMEMHQFRFEDSRQLQPQLDHLLDLRSRTTAAGITITDLDYLLTVIMALPPSYSILRTSILASKNKIEEIKLDVILPIVLQEEAQRKGVAGNTDSSEHALYTQKSRRQGPSHPNAGDKKPPVRDGKCKYCDREGHWQAECRTKAADDAKGEVGPRRKKVLAAMSAQGGSGAGKPPKLAWAAEAKPARTLSTDVVWTFDSAASSHFCPDRASFTTYKTLDIPEEIALGDGRIALAVGIGNVNVRLRDAVNNEIFPVTLTSVLHSTGMERLISIGQITSSPDTSVTFNQSGCTIQHRNGPAFHVERTGTMFKAVDVPLHSANAVEKKPVVLSMRDAHLRFGHLSESGLLEIAKKNIIAGISIDTTSPLGPCDECIRAKHSRTPFPSGQANRATELLELIHSDLCGPFPPTINGYKYFCTFIDDKSRRIAVYCLKTKDQAMPMFRLFKAEVENQTGKRIRRLRTDRGGEYDSLEDRAWLGKEGIVHEKTAAYTPQQNGLGERVNRTVVSFVRACLLSSVNLSNAFWGECLFYVVHTVNRSPHSALDNTTPFEVWTGRKPDASHMRPFGTVVYVHVPKKLRKKLDARSERCYLVGYSADTKAYRCRNPVKRDVVISRDVRFIEDATSDPGSPDITFDWPSDDGDDSPVDPAASSDAPPSTLPASEAVGAVEPQPSPEPVGDAPPPPDQPEAPVVPPPAPSPPPSPPSRRSARLGAGRNATREKDNAWKNVTDSGKILHHAKVAEVSDMPRTYREAMVRDDSEKWEPSFREEIEALKDNGTWDPEPVDLPEGRTAVGCGWVCRIKTNAQGETVRYRSRLVAKGFTQREGIDYTEVFAPVVKLDSVRAVLTYAATNDLEIHQMDVKNAYLNGVLEEEIYMRQPEGFEVPGTEGKVLRLRKALYGLKQSGRTWYKTVSSAFGELHLIRSEADFSVYFGRQGTSFVIIYIHVDDMALITNSTPRLLVIKTDLGSRFKMVDMGELKYFLSIEHTRNRTDRTITLSQSHYIRKVLERFNMADASPVATPIAHGAIFSEEDCPADGSLEQERMKDVPYIEALGCLMYAMTSTRPDIAYALGVLSRFARNPGERHWGHLKHLLRYMKGTADYALTLGGTGPLILEAYSDADFQGDRDNSKSTSGYVIFFGAGAVAWSSKRQGCVAMSTTEAEYMALTHCAREVIWYRSLLEDIGLPQSEPTMIFGDNMGSLALATNPTNHSLAKHIKRHYHFIRHSIEDGDINVSYVNTSDQIADVMTKGLGWEKHGRFTELMGLEVMED